MTYETAFKGLLWSMLLVIVFLMGYFAVSLTPYVEPALEFCTILFDRFALLLTTD